MLLADIQSHALQLLLQLLGERSDEFVREQKLLVVFFVQPATNSRTPGSSWLP